MPAGLPASPQEAETLYELAQEDLQRRHCEAAAAACASCIYEPVPGRTCPPHLRSSLPAFAAHRAAWPLRPVVARLLLQSGRLTRLVTALLGRQAVLYNEQVRPALCHGSEGDA